MEMNAVHVGRFSNGNVISGQVQENRVTIFAPDGSPLLETSLTGWPERPERRPDGRLRGLPGYTIALTMGDDGRASLLDGSLRRVRRFDPDGRVIGDYSLDLPVITIIWTGTTTAWGIDGSDRVIRFTAAGDSGHSSPETPVTGDDPQVGIADLPGQLVERIGDLPAWLRERDCVRQAGPDRGGLLLDRPAVVGGRTQLYLGYGDGPGLLLSRAGDGSGTDWPGFTVTGSVAAHPRGSLSSRVVMAGDTPILFDRSLGLFPFEVDESGYRWPAGSWPSDVLWLSGDRWLIHDSLQTDGDPLLLLDLSTGRSRPAGGSGDHRRMGPVFRPVWNWWWLRRGDDDRVVLFDEASLRITDWTEPGITDWRPVTGSGLRTVEERKRAGMIDREISNCCVIGEIGLLIVATDTAADLPDSRLILVSFEGQTLRQWHLPVLLSITGMALAPWGGFYLSTKNALLEWSGWETAISG